MKKEPLFRTKQNSKNNQGDILKIQGSSSSSLTEMEQNKFFRPVCFSSAKWEIPMDLFIFFVYIATRVSFFFYGRFLDRVFFSFGEGLMKHCSSLKIFRELRNK